MTTVWAMFGALADMIFTPGQHREHAARTHAAAPIESENLVLSSGTTSAQSAVA